MQFTIAEVEALKLIIRDELVQLLRVYLPLKMSGTNFLGAKQEAPTTQPSIRETDITALSNSLLLLGGELENLDSLISSLTSIRKRLHNAYSFVTVGNPGQPVAES